MKNFRFLTFVLTVATLILSACGAAASTATPAARSVPQKVDAMPVAFVGIVDSIAGDQWVISGTTVTVDMSIVRDGPFNVGDRIKVEGFANPDGSFTVSRVEAPTPQETATMPSVSVDNSNEALINANTNESNVNDDGSANTNDDSSNTNDDHGVNTNDDNSSGGNTNDDNSVNTNDDNSNDGNTNDDNGGGNTNDDNGSNSNDDNGNDDNSGSGGGNDNSGNDDNGSGGNGNDD